MDGGFDGQGGAYTLGVSGPCTPSCAGKQCGDDGCGGSCGSCGAGQTCIRGTCASATFGGTWADLDGDSYLDLYVGGYESGPTCGYCPDAILMNNRNGTFTRAWIQVGDVNPARGVTEEAGAYTANATEGGLEGWRDSFIPPRGWLDAVLILKRET